MGICICCCCNKNKSDCLETTLIVFSSIEIAFLVISLIIINWKVAGTLNLIFNLVILFLLVFNLVVATIFKCFREYQTIYSQYKKISYILSYIGMSFTIVILILSILTESLISEKIYKYDHPCIDKMSEFKQEKIGNILQSVYEQREDNETEINKFCENITTEGNIEISYILWYNKRSAFKDIIMPCLCLSLIEFFSLFKICLWHNEARRIKYCVREKMFEDSGLVIYGPLGAFKGTANKKNNNEIPKIINIKVKNSNKNKTVKIKDNNNKRNNNDNNKKKERKNDINYNIINNNDNNNNNKNVSKSTSSNDNDKHNRNRERKIEITIIDENQKINEVDIQSLQSKQSVEKREFREKPPTINSEEFYYDDI